MLTIPNLSSAFAFVMVACVVRCEVQGDLLDQHASAKAEETERKAGVQMKLQFALMALLSTATCGAAQNSDENIVPANGYVPDPTTATAIARAVLTPIFGKKKIDSEEPLHARRDGVFGLSKAIRTVPDKSPTAPAVPSTLNYLPKTGRFYSHSPIALGLQSRPFLGGVLFSWWSPLLRCRFTRSRGDAEESDVKQSRCHPRPSEARGREPRI